MHARIHASFVVGYTRRLTVTHKQAQPMAKSAARLGAPLPGGNLAGSSSAPALRGGEALKADVTERELIGGMHPHEVEARLQVEFGTPTPEYMDMMRSLSHRSQEYLQYMEQAGFPYQALKHNIARKHKATAWQPTEKDMLMGSTALAREEQQRRKQSLLQHPPRAFSALPFAHYKRIDHAFLREPRWPTDEGAPHLQPTAMLVPPGAYTPPLVDPRTGHGAKILGPQRPRTAAERRTVEMTAVGPGTYWPPLGRHRQPISGACAAHTPRAAGCTHARRAARPHIP